MSAGRSVLAEADDLINGQRRIDYGPVLPNFTTIAGLWSPVLGVTVTAEQVALCMIGVKIARTMNGGFHRDSVVDIAGYAGCLEKIANERAANQITDLEAEKDAGHACEVCGCHANCVAGCHFVMRGGRSTVCCTRCTESEPTP